MPRKTPMPSPLPAARKVGFVFDTDLFDKENVRNMGKCICGTKCYVSRDSLVKQQYCRNEDCEYYQPKRKIDQHEMRLIAEDEKCCTVHDITGSGVRAIVTITCVCGVYQKATWNHLRSEDWCINRNCEHYRKHQQLTTEMIKMWIEGENYSMPKTFEYEKKHGSYYAQKIRLRCPNGHPHKTSVEQWVKGIRCKICNGDGRTLSYFTLKEYYESYGCKIELSEDEFVGNCTHNTVPFVCSNGHYIDNLTKNLFDNRIAQDLGPCAECNHNGMLSKGVIHHMQLPEIASKLQHGNNYKTYVMPSGKELRIQGCENACLDLLLQEYREENIYNDKEQIPDFRYYNAERQIQSRYYPDFMIEGENLIIEVKSLYFFQLQYDNNLAKFQSVVDEGYSLQVYVFDEKNTLLSIWRFFPGCNIYNMFGRVNPRQCDKAKTAVSAT